MINEITQQAKVRYESGSFYSKRDLLIKKIVVTLIALLNFAALGFALYAIIAYCNILTQALLISPFIVGVLGALKHLDFPTLGITSSNYTQYTNPATILGKILTYIFFGPYFYAAKKCDWTAYHDSDVAQKLAHQISRRDDKAFERLAKLHGEHFDNFARYGIIPETFRDHFINLFKWYRPLQKEYEHYEKRGLAWHERAEQIKIEKQHIEAQWIDIRNQVAPSLYYPPLDDYDFTSRLTLIRVAIADFFKDPLGHLS